MNRDALLLMLLDAPSGPSGRRSAIQGTTRLQKLLFLIEKEANIEISDGRDFDFTAYKFGPVSKDLYDDLAKLENLGFIATEAVAEPSTVELDEYGLSFEGLMGEEATESTGSFEERRYAITDAGRRWLERQRVSESVAEKVRKIKGKYGALSLSDLLYTVYTRYPEMTTASEIKDRVLRR